MSRRHWALWLASSDLSARFRSVLELCAVALIMLVLMGFALDAYKYIYARAQVVEIASLAGTPKHDAMFAHALTGRWVDPSAVRDRADALPKGRYADTLDVSDDGLITFRMKSTGVLNDVRERRLTYSPSLEGGVILWHCRPDVSDDKVIAPQSLPRICRE
ncbi:MAG: pilin [Gammaproteobacteria bacterium]